MPRLLSVLTLVLAAACGRHEGRAQAEGHDSDHGVAHAENEEHADDVDRAAHTDSSEAAENHHAEDSDMPAAASFHSLKVNDLEGNAVDLAKYEGQVCLVVNLASECGYTPQYEGLQQLHEEMSLLGVTVLGFPSNEFGGQEPGSAEQIREFCTSRFGVSFPMFAKVETQPGAGQSPLYALLGAATGELPNWNFCKYLIDKDGTPIGFFPSKVEPGSDELRDAIQDAL